MRRVSVIVPTYNRPLTLREALASIRALDRVYDEIEFEVVVGDNGLTDATRELCEEFGAVYAPAPGRGASYARNAALKAATGDFIGFLDDDDAWLPGHIRPHLAYLDAHPEHDAVFGQAISTDEHLRPTGEPWPQEDPGTGDELTRTMLSGLFPQLGTVIVRKSAADRIGYFDPSLIGGQDLDWLLRLASKKKLGHIQSPCILFRGRAPGTSSDALQRMRIGFDCKVFLRHGLPIAHRMWKSPLAFIRAYHASLFHYYQYFSRKAMQCAAADGAIRDLAEALAPLVLYLPLLLLSDFVRPSPLRKAVIGRLLRRDPTMAG